MKIFKIQLIVLCVWLAAGGTALLAADLNLSNSSTKTEWPSIAVNAAGQIMVVWTEWEGMGNVYYRVYEGGTWSAKKNAHIVRQWAWSNQLDVDSSGRFHLSFADGYGSTTRDIYHSLYLGTSWRNADMLFNSPHNSAWNKMSVDSNDEVNVIWYHKYYDPPGVSDVVAMRKSVGASWPSNYTNLSNRSLQESIHPAIRVKNRHAYAVWMEGTSGGWNLRFSEASNWSWTAPISIVGVGYYPAMALDSQGGVHVAYSNRSGNFHVISREGNSWGSSRVVSGGTAPLQFGDIRHHSGFLVATWVEDHGGVYYVYYANKKVGGAWSRPIRVSSGDSLGDGNKHAQVAVDNQGFAHIVWEGRGAGGREDIFYSKVQLAEPDSPFIEVDKLFLDFKVDQYQNPAPQAFILRNSGTGSLNYTMKTNRNWLVVNPAVGDNSGEDDIISVRVDSGTKAPGIYDGAITIESAEAFNSPLVLNVSLTIEKAKKPQIGLSTTSLFFEQLAHGNNANPQSFAIRNTGAASLNYQIESSHNWLKVSPASGSSTGEWDTVAVSIDAKTYAVGTYNGFLRIKAPDAVNSPEIISVTLRIDLPPQPYPPVSVKVSQLAHVGLMIRIFKNTITWRGNSKNDGIFNINKFRIWRRLRTGSSYDFVGEVGSNVFSLTEEDFTSLEDRDKWVYAVSCVDLIGRESIKREPNIADAALFLKTLPESNQTEIRK